MIDNITIRQDELIHLRPLPVKFCLLPRASFQPSFRKPEFKISMNMSVIGSPEFCRRTDINLMSKVDADPHGICFQLMLWSNVFALLPLNHIHPGRFGSDPHIHVFGKKIHPRRDLLLRFFRQTTQIIPAFTDAQARIRFLSDRFIKRIISLIERVNDRKVGVVFYRALHVAVIASQYLDGVITLLVTNPFLVKASRGDAK